MTMQHEHSASYCDLSKREKWRRKMAKMQNHSTAPRPETRATIAGFCEPRGKFRKHWGELLRGSRHL